MQSPLPATPGTRTKRDGARDHRSCSGIAAELSGSLQFVGAAFTFLFRRCCSAAMSFSAWLDISDRGFNSMWFAH